MTSIRAIVLSTLLPVLVATPAAAKEKKPTKSAASKSTAGRSTPAVERSDPKGFTINVPGEVTEKRDEWSTSYATLLSADSVKLNATIKVVTLDELTPDTNLDKAVEAALALRPQGAPKGNVTEQREVPRGYLVVIGPDYDTYSVDVTRNGKEVQVKAHCTGPGSHLKELKEMCLSVKPTK
ncbi:hypothetical protein [Vitiosangium sp. GDMCC 1.1324]|uniref:hypothetical protein n=1 Tax=Vitiosangium sp. (strain GDMCC 1.1324) TaxID=2138576 RepID=UPI000D3785F4|nr:hypothetical protein [Vitiosangium sp. GDMCC 1.1324]PTL75482.1 hypothetical protein DAT35_54455 [Vitiosangium sp. GDMCC 1.1324]